MLIHLEMFRGIVGTIAGTIVGCAIFNVEIVRKTSEKFISDKFTLLMRAPVEPSTTGEICIKEAISFNTYTEFRTKFRTALSDDNVSIVKIKLESFGGCASSTLLIAHTISLSAKPVICEISSHALSAGTLIALVCDQIQMDYGAVLSPIDPVVMEGDKKLLMRDYPECVRNSVSSQKGELRVTVKDHYEAESQELYFNIYKDRVRKLLQKKHSPVVVDEIIQNMIEQYQPHNRFYTAEEAKDVIPYLTITNP